MSISIVVPVYNSERTLDELVRRLQAVLLPIEREFEILLINDGSADGSWARISALVEHQPHVRGVNLARNYGQHNALLCGIRLARNDVVVTLDDDLQNPPEEIPRLLKSLEQGFDVVYGTSLSPQHGFFRRVAVRILKIVLRHVLGNDLAEMTSPFRAFRRSICKAFADYSNPFVSIDVLLTWGTSRFTHITVQHVSRQHGRTNYKFTTLMILAINMVTGFSILPLQMVSVLGLTFAFLGFAILGYIFIGYMIRGTTVAGFPFLASVIAIFSGVQLFALGIMGEYLARIHGRLMQRPVYVIQDQIGSSAA